LWEPAGGLPSGNATIFQCVRPLTEVGDLQKPQTQRINPRLHLVPGDLALAGFENFLSQEWPNALGSGNHYRPFRILSSFWQVAQMAAQQHQADLILADVGPSLGAINRSALIATDHVVIPLAADLYSLQGAAQPGPPRCAPGAASGPHAGPTGRSRALRCPTARCSPWATC
jgi:chromosome partitioning protein